MDKRITISFTEQERRALVKLAEADMRPLPDQVRFLVRSEAERRGLWPERVASLAEHPFHPPQPVNG
jgi:hypothetical protein